MKKIWSNNVLAIIIVVLMLVISISSAFTVKLGTDDGGIDWIGTRHADQFGETATFVIFKELDGTYCALNTTLGKVTYTGSDCAEVIQYAIDSTQNDTTGGTGAYHFAHIYVKPGTYTLASPVYINNSGITIQGGGIESKFVVTNNKYGFQVYNSSHDLYSITFRDIFLYRSGDTQNGTGIKIIGGNYILFDNVGGDSFSKFLWLDDTEHSWVSNCYGEQDTYGVYIVNSSSRINIDKCNFRLQLGVDGACYYANGCNYFTISNSQAGGCSGSSNGYGIYLDTCERVIIDGCHVFQMDKDGILLDDCVNVDLEAGCWANSEDTVGSYDGINITGASTYNIFIHDSFSTTWTTISPYQRYGIVVWNGVNVSIDTCYVGANSVTGIYDATGNAVVKNCIGSLEYPFINMTRLGTITLDTQNDIYFNKSGTQMARITQVGDDTILYGGTGTSDDFVIYCNDEDTLPSLTMYNDATVLLKAASDLYLGGTKIYFNSLVADYGYVDSNTDGMIFNATKGTVTIDDCLLINPVASLPNNPVQGMIVFYTGNNTLCCWTGTGWKGFW